MASVKTLIVAVLLLSANTTLAAELLPRDCTATMQSPISNDQTWVTFTNMSDLAINVYWHNSAGEKKLLRELDAMDATIFELRTGAVLSIEYPGTNNCYWAYTAIGVPATISFTGGWLKNRGCDNIIPTQSGATEAAKISFRNTRSEEVEFFWVKQDGTHQSFGRIPAGESKTQSTYASHVWVVKNVAGECLGSFRALDQLWAKVQ